MYYVDDFLLQESDYPYVLGVAGEGIVRSVREGVEGLKEGDRVSYCHWYRETIMIMTLLCR